jgi:hypothetical protein
VGALSGAPDLTDSRRILSARCRSCVPGYERLPDSRWCPENAVAGNARFAATRRGDKEPQPQPGTTPA